MTEYTVLKTIVLSFATHNDSIEVIFDPRTVAGHLEFDGKDIRYIDITGKPHISQTTNNAIELWLQQGKIEVKK